MDRVMRSLALVSLAFAAVAVAVAVAEPVPMSRRHAARLRQTSP